MKNEANQHVSQIVPDSHFVDYTEDKYLKEDKKYKGYDTYDSQSILGFCLLWRQGIGMGGVLFLIRD